MALRFTHLYLENWRNFTRVEADLGRRMIVAGPNACGKTNLLDGFRFLHDLVAARCGFQEAVRRRGGVPRLRCLAARQHSDVIIAVRAGNGEQAPDWEYELRFGQAESERRPSISCERVTLGGEDILVRPDDCDREDPERLTATCLEQVGSNRPFRELAAFLASVRYFHASPQLVREPDRAGRRRNDPYGSDLLERIAATPEKVRDARLRRIRDVLGEIAPQLRDLQLWRDATGAPHLRARYGHWRPLGAWQTEEQFSDGTLRLAALLWTAMECSGPLLAEEPEISLDQAAVRRVLKALGKTQRRSGSQVLISTQSEDLIAGGEVEPGDCLMLIPGEEGTSVRQAVGPEDIRALLDGTLAEREAAAAEARAAASRQMDLFGAP
jgi:predicted ATPase